MASNNTSQATQRATLGKNSVDPKPLFQRFEWVDPNSQADTGSYRMLSNIRDLSAGAALAMQFVERANMQLDNKEAPIISRAEAERFTRMSITVMNWVMNTIDEHFDGMISPSADTDDGVSS